MSWKTNDFDCKFIITVFYLTLYTTYTKMDYVGEVIALGIDALILGACIKQYLKNRKAMQMIQVRICFLHYTVLINACAGSPLFGN